MDKQERNPVVGSLSALAGTAVAAVSGWITYSALGIDHNLPLPPAIPAGRQEFDDPKVGQLSYYVDLEAEGRPLLLVHSINAAGSAYEMRPIFEQVQGERPVYALDLPGFGFSERANRTYTPDLYAWAIIGMLEQIGQTADVVALSLGSEFAARAALARPELFHSLALISPSGFTDRGNKRASQQAGDDGSSGLFYTAFTFPLWSQALYDLLATRPSIRYFLQQSFVGEADQGLAEYGYLTTHQPGARHAPLAFVSGKLFTPDAHRELYGPLTVPTLVLYDKDAFVRFDLLPEVEASNEQLSSTRIPGTLGLPQFEKPAATMEALDVFWR